MIGSELYQNMVSSLLAIFLTVLIFLGSLRGACIVIFCVAATIIEVAGFMHFWGLTVDVISCNTLVISVGLCVDFSAHIAHGFLSSTGDRNQRIQATLVKIGPAVLNGGMSTLLAFILLATSKSYIFQSFFKIFFLICVLGLYHGLVALPVILSVAGPLPQVRMKPTVQTKPNELYLQVEETVLEAGEKSLLYPHSKGPKQKAKNAKCGKELANIVEKKE